MDNFKILKVFGDDDYAANMFESSFDSQKIMREMIVEGVTEKTLNVNDEFIYVELLEFSSAEELFDYYKSEMQDYDDSKHTNYYKAK
jgi:hypothetical protein